MSRAILLLPSPDDPHGLLTAGRCVATPPTTWVRRHKWGDKCVDARCQRAHHMENPPKLALVLGWDGEPVPEGCDRAARVLAAHEGLAIPWGVLWMPAGGAMYSWALDGWEDERSYAPEASSSGEIVVPALADSGRAGATLLSTLALATVSADRLGGEVVLVDGEEGSR